MADTTPQQPSGINLLPDDLRAREAAERRNQASGAQSPREFSHPGASAHTPSVDPAPVPSNWQRLMAALKANLSKPTTNEVVPQPVVPRRPPPVAPLVQPPQLRTAEPAPRSAVAPALVHPTSPVTAPAMPRGTQAPVSPKLPSSLPEVNLIPALERGNTQRRSLVITLLVVVVALVLVVVGYLAAQTRRAKAQANLQAAQQAITTLQGELETKRTQLEQAMTTRDRVAEAVTLLEHRTMWEPLFTFLEQNTVPTVYYSSLAADVDGNVTLSAVAPNYTEAARQLKAYELAPEVNLVQLSGLKQEVSQSRSASASISFGLTLSLKPELFSATAQTATP